MNSFDEACKVETESRKILEPLFDIAAYKGRWVANSKGRIAKFLQVSVGDFQMNTDPDTVYSIELKAERQSSKNFFLEAWSNRSLFNPGWMWKADADLLLYHFLSSDDLYCMDFQQLKRWFHDCPEGDTPPWTKWRQKEQGKYKQRNDTWGVLIPIVEIELAVGYDLIHPLNNLAGTEHRPKGERAPMKQVRLSGQAEQPMRPGPAILDEYLGRRN